MGTRSAAAPRTAAPRARANAKMKSKARAAPTPTPRAASPLKPRSASQTTPRSASPTKPRSAPPTKPRAAPAATARALPARRGRPPRGLNGEEAVLGGNVRSTRIIRGLKLRDLATRTGCSESLLSKIENGHARPSISMLHRIAASLDTTVPALFAAREAGEGLIGRAGERASTRIDGKGSRIERLVPAGSGHQLEGNLHILAPGGGSAGTLAHPGEEVGFVISGELELVVDGEKHRIGAGDSFVFRSELKHSYRNPGRTETRVVWISTPPTF
jgi:transcriptional regulator with XRE-family HTH domain